MGTRASYSESDKARIFVVLSANDGNVKRSARETGVPESTIRHFRAEWLKKGPPPADAMDEAVGDFVDEAKSLRGLGLQALRLKVERLVKDPDKVKVAELTTLVGVLTDKIDRASGLDVKRVEHEHKLQSADEIRELMAGFIQASIISARARQADIEITDVVEQPALPRGR